MAKLVLLENIHTQEELQATISQVDSILVHLFQTEKLGKSISLNEILDRVAGIKLSQLVKNDLEEQKINSTDLFSLKTYFEKLRNSLSQVKTFQVILAVDPGTELVKTISEWVHKQIDPEAILSISVDSSILGGAVIIYGGKYHNLSLANEIYQNVTSSKAKILESLAGFKAITSPNSPTDLPLDSASNKAV